MIRELLPGRFKSVSEVRLLHENVILSDELREGFTRASQKCPVIGL